MDSLLSVSCHSWILCWFNIVVYQACTALLQGAFGYLLYILSFPCCYISFSLPLSFPPSYLFNLHLMMYLLILERRGERERERDTDAREKHRCERESWISCFSHAPWLGIEPATFWWTGQHSRQLSHLARAMLLNFLKRILTIYKLLSHCFLPSLSPRF